MATEASARAVCLFDETGELLWSNPDHGRLLRRRPSDIVGQTWRSWTPTDRLGAAEKNFQRSLAGEPATFIRHIMLPDGLTGIFRAHLTARRSGARRVVVGTMTMLPVAPEIASASVADIGAYVASLSADLAEIACRRGLARLGRSLAEIAGEAGRSAEALSARAFGDGDVGH